MLKGTQVVASRRLHKWSSKSVLGHRTATLAVPTFFEDFLAPQISARQSVQEIVKSYWNKCVAAIRGASIRTLTPKKAVESSTALCVRSPPSTQTPGIFTRGWRSIGNTREYLYRNVYSQYSSSDKKWIWRLVAANGFTLFLWQTYGTSVSGRQSMWENFMVSIKSVRVGRLWVFFFSSVSSNDLITFGLNTTSLLSFGIPILAAIGTVPFLSLYLGSSLFGALTHMTSFAFPTESQTPTANQLWYSDHASFHSSTAAASALAGFYAGAWATKPVPVAKVLNVPSAIVAASFALLQIYHADNTRQPWQGNISGFMLGVAVGFLFRNRVRL